MSRSRPKLDTSPIQYDDGVDSPSMKGMVSFLEVPPGELPRLDFTRSDGNPAGKGIPFSDPIESGIPLIEIPVPALEPDKGAIERAPLETGTPFSPLPISRTPAAGAASSAPAIDYAPMISRPIARVRRATLAQDGHSFGEQALYEALWQHAHPRDNDSRIITLGYRRMSELARLTVNNCKANIQALIAKLAVEEAAGFTHSQGRTYLDW